MKVVVLAGGKSRRLKPIEDKNFLRLLGKPLLQHQLEQLVAAGLTDFIIVGSSENLGKIRSLVRDLEKSGSPWATKVEIKVVEQKNPAGMAGALFAAEKLLKSSPMLIVSANDVVEKSAYESMLHEIKKTAAGVSVLLLVKKIQGYFPGGYLKISQSGRITGIVEKPKPGSEPGKFVNLVVHFHRDSNALFTALHQVKSDHDDRYELALNQLLKSGSGRQPGSSKRSDNSRQSNGKQFAPAIKAVPYNGFWQPIKYPWHVLQVAEYFLSQMQNGLKKGHQVEIAKSAQIRGNVFLDNGVKVLENAVIVGPAFIGKNTIIATNSLVRESIIGENCVIGFGTEVARSFVGSHVWTHTNYIGDSIIGDDCSFGAGTVTGNLRLDEGEISVMVQDEKINSERSKLGLVTGSHVRCGINTSFMPGVKIGNNCLIGAGILVGSDVPDGQLVYAKTELMMKENKSQINDKKRTEMKKNLAHRKSSLQTN